MCMNEGSNKFYVMGVWEYMPKNYKNLNPKVSKTLNHSFSIKLKRNSMYKWNLLSINSVLCEWRNEKWIISVKNNVLHGKAGKIVNFYIGKWNSCFHYNFHFTILISIYYKV